MADRFGVRTTAEYERVVADPEVDAIYVALPNALHEPWTLRALAAGKHVYCEKPATLDLAGAERVAAAARQHRRVFLEGFMFLFHPQHGEVRALIQAGAIGEPLHFDGWFGIPSGDPANFRYSAALGGGAFNDAGGYPLHAARLVFQSEPRVLAARFYRQAGEEVDTRGAAALEFPGGRTAQISFGFGLGYRNAYSVWGSAGLLLLERAYSVPPDHRPTVLLRNGRGREEARPLEPANHFELALDAFLEAVVGTRPFDTFLPDFLALARLRESVRQFAGAAVTT